MGQRGGLSSSLNCFSRQLMIWVCCLTHSACSCHRVALVLESATLFLASRDAVEVSTIGLVTFVFCCVNLFFPVDGNMAAECKGGRCLGVLIPLCPPF